MEAPARKAVFRAQQNYEIGMKRLQEDYDLAMYRAAADGMDFLYMRYRWNHDRFMEIRQSVLDEVNAALARDRRDQAILQMHENNFDLLARRVFRNPSYRLSDLLREAESLHSWTTEHASWELRQFMNLDPCPEQKRERSEWDEEDDRRSQVSKS